MSGTAQQSSVPGNFPVPGGEDISRVGTREQELSLADLTNTWTLGVGSHRSLGRPKEWNGESKGFDDFALKFASCLSGLLGDAEGLLEESAHMGRPIVLATLGPREKVAARGVATALRALVGGKALSCIRHRQRNSMDARCGDSCTRRTDLTQQRETLDCWNE